MQANQLLREMLRVRTISQKELSLRLGKSPNYVSRMLAGGFNPNVGTLAQLCAVLNFQLVLRDIEKGAEIIIDPPVGE